MANLSVSQLVPFNPITFDPIFFAFAGSTVYTHAQSAHSLQQVVSIIKLTGTYYVSTCVAREDKALGYRSGGHVFEPCHGHLRCALFG